MADNTTDAEPKKKKKKKGRIKFNGLGVKLRGRVPRKTRKLLKRVGLKVD